MTTKVAVFTDYACPWSYLGRARLLAALEGLDAVVHVLHFPLSTDVPEDGLPLRQRLAALGYHDLDVSHHRLARLLADAGLDWHESADDAWSYNSRRAQELACWAVRHRGGDAIHDALFRAYQVDARNLADIDVLVDVAAGIGLDPREAHAVLRSGMFGYEVDRHWALGAKLGITSVPTYVVGGEVLVGVHPVEALRRLVVQGSTSRRAPSEPAAPA